MPLVSPSPEPHFKLPTSLEPAHEERRLEPVPHPAGIWIDWGPAVPAEYAQDRLSLMVRDPWCVFAYWELTGAHAKWLPEKHGPGVFATGKWRVRLFRGASAVAEIVASHPLGTHYFPVEPDAAWRAEVGLRLPSGEWVVVAASEEVRTPRAWIAAVTDDAWAVSEEEMLRQLGFTVEEAARRAEVARRSRGQVGYSTLPPGPGSSSR
jgi:hypothetical protein